MSVEREFAEKVHDHFVTKNCEMSIIEKFLVPFCLKGKFQEKSALKLERERLLLVTAGLKIWDRLFY